MKFNSKSINFGLSTSDFKTPESGRIGIKIDIDDNEVKLLSKNLKNVGTVVTYTAARALSYVVLDLLSLSLPRTPYDTGQLRESGRAVITFGGSYVYVGKGHKDGTVSATMGKINRAKVSKAVNLQGHVSFARTNSKWEDIALWAHEALHPYEDRFNAEQGDGEYYARQPHTGPKYLEIPWLENQDRYISLIKTAIMQDSFVNMNKLLKTIRTKKGKYGIDQVQLVVEKIDTLGYFNQPPPSRATSSPFLDEATLARMHQVNQ